MAEAAGALSAATMEMINTRATAQYESWKNGTTAEQKAKANKDLEDWNANEEFKAAHMAKMNNAWADAGPDANGRMQLAGYKVWMAKMIELKTERGDWIEPGDNSEADYAIANSVDPDNEGIKQAELWQVIGPWHQKFQALKAADGL